MTADGLTLEYLERWVLSGAHWHAVEVTDRYAVVDLCACTGEPVQRLRCEDPAVIDYLGSASSDLDM